MLILAREKQNHALFLLSFFKNCILISIILSLYYVSVSMLPDNPYLRPETEGGRMRPASINGGEVYYSDSDEDSGAYMSKTDSTM